MGADLQSPRPQPEHEPARLSTAQVGELLEGLRDPSRLRRRQAELAVALPHLAIPEPRNIVQDLREALRMARSGLDEVSDAAARRYHIMETLLQGASPKQAAAQHHVSLPTLYRARREAVEELAPHLDALWRRHPAAPSTTPIPGESSLESEGIPAPPVFIGRQEELARATEMLASARMLVIGGLAGIGKTSFAAVLAHQEAIVRPVLWHHLRPGLSDSVAGVLFSVALRLNRLGSTAPLAFMREASASSTWQPLAENLVAQAAEFHRLTMVFDGAEVIADNAEVCGLLSGLLADTPSCRMLLVSKQRLPHLPDAVRIELGGLETAAVQDYLSAHGLAGLPVATVELLARHTGGNPQLLHLATGALRHGDLATADLGDRLLEAADIQAYFFDQIYRQLSEGERLILGATALVRGPEPSSFLATALDRLAPSVPATLGELGRRYLLTHGSDGLRLHSSVRELVRRMLPLSERQTLHLRLAHAYQRAGRFDEACHHWLEAGELREARNALLANRPDAPPHVRSRLRALIDGLYRAGFEDDAELNAFARSLAPRR